MTTHNERARAVVRGAVQGVGFRPFVYRLAKELRLNGWVLNSSQGVFIEAEGVGATLREFLLRLEREKPARAIIQSMEFSFLDAVGYSGFVIRDSEESGAKSAFILPDIAPCEQCLIDIFSPTNRRFRYPFTNCTNCGPRFSIIEHLPYDRPNTSMKKFKLCAICEKEYHDPADRRFHAQPNACPNCGPQLEFWDADGNVLASGDAALRRTAEGLRTGKIIALKGLGGFQLLADARDETVVKRLRKRKHRAEKPLALMYPSLALVRRDCHVSQLEERLLLSPEAPIVLLHRWSPPLAPSIAPGNPTLGVMLPSTPLHHLLMREIGFPIVCTSGNLSDEPICTDEREALSHLDGIADFFVVHNRPIVRPMDDSVVRVVRGREMVLRRARSSQEHRRAQRRPRSVHQPAHRRSRDQRGARCVPHRGRRFAPPLRCHTGDHCVRSSPRLSLDQVCCPSCGGDRRRRPPRPASLGPRPRLHGRERSSVSRPRRGVGWHRLRHRWHDLGRRVPARARGRLRAHRAFAPVPSSGR
jgi:hydrogenase maturation protein HypF